MKQSIVGGRHQGLNSIGGGGFARAVTAREQVDFVKAQATVGNVAPVNVKEFS